MPRKRRRRSIRFGSYVPQEDLIRIHPLLDQPFVPEYFVRYIVFHEMLHAYLGRSEGLSEHALSHSPEFRQMERAYPDYVCAQAWENSRGNLAKLLRRIPV
jgi:predicted metal-dependent hydrolase